MRLLLDHGADVNAHSLSSREQTSLYGAAGIANNPELTRMLLAAGARVNEPQEEPGTEVKAGSYGLEALYHASEFADVTCLRLLLEASPPPHPKRVSYCLARMLDFENPDGVELYLRHGADPNFRVPWMHDRTHLHRAVVYGRSLSIVRLLVEAGGDPNARDDLGLTPLRSAVRHGREDVAGLLRGAGGHESSLTADDRAPARFDPDLLCYVAGGTTSRRLAAFSIVTPTPTRSAARFTPVRPCAGGAGPRRPGSSSTGARTSINVTATAATRWRRPSTAR